MSLSVPWNSTPSSDAKLNLMTNISDTGDNLSALDKTKHKLVICTSTGSGFTINHLYLFSADGTTAIDVTAVAAHTHSGSTDGGDIVDVFRSNPKFMDLVLTKATDLFETNWASPEFWIKTIVTTGVVANDTDGTSGERSIKLTTGTTSGGAATINYPHLQLNFAKRSVFQFKGRLSANTTLAAHSGVNADDVTAADSNTIKYNAEVCTATNTNWFLRTADGSANSTSDSGTAFTTNRVGIRIEHFPDLGTPRADMYIDAGTVFSKTTNIPVSGTTADNNIIKHSLKCSAGSASRDYFVYGSRLRYTISDDWA